MSWLFRGSYLVLLALSIAQTRRPLLRRYRWCGTRRGAPAMIVLIPAAFCAIGLLVTGLMEPADT